MVGKPVLLTQEGLKRLEEELDYLKRIKRREVAQRIKEALAFGDISENSEYDDAKNEQAFIEGRIAELESRLRNAEIIDENTSGESVTIGSTVTLKDVETGDIFEFTLVGSTEADPAKNRISNESPVGKAILGRKTGEVVHVNAPAGNIAYKIEKVN
ncbi:MAG TPA: transcription elongation factor GreA [Bacillota bacterium]|jgi:transcription elongation factor GreA|nr:transcription elongation factor GreA [Bacillota bacterium]NLU54471.1 transcription elongation factor GreA [Bacillota bacterium]HOA91337.1 transcription elongation factor GreA [Bacillota bacterium]HOL13554.1 transcription elongation factor GreA [Bacillota bacterium]HOP54079.1 transcription elongation factor GreA [Bacillota bacterium]